MESPGPGILGRAEGVDPYQKVLTASLDLFSTPYMDLTADNCYTAEYSPTVPIGQNNSDDISFELSMSTDYTDLSRSNIMIETHIETEAGGQLPPFTETESVAFDQV